MFNITKSLRRIITLFFGLLIIIVMSLFSFVGEKKSMKHLKKRLMLECLKQPSKLHKA